MPVNDRDRENTPTLPRCNICAVGVSHRATIPFTPEVRMARFTVFAVLLCIVGVAGNAWPNESRKAPILVTQFENGLFAGPDRGYPMASASH